MIEFERRKDINMEVLPSPEVMAASIGEYWRELQSGTEGKFFIAAPLSSTPLPLYSWVVQHAGDFTNWDQFKFLLMDEQVEGENSFTYVLPTDSASYEKFAREKFLESLEAANDVTNSLIKPDLNEMGKFDQMVSQHGGIDLLILAIGVKGHYAQVMPGTPLETGFHITRLIPELAQAHTKQGSQSYAGAHFREFGMSLGPKQVLEAKNILLMISGESKGELTKDLLGRNSFDPDFPISIIHHPVVRVKTKLFISEEVLK